MPAPTMRRMLIWVLVLVALLGVFMLYLRPDFMVQLAQQAWSCF